MDGSYNLASFHHQNHHRYFSEDDVKLGISGENNFRHTEHNRQCCNEPLRRRLRSSDHRSQSSDHRSSQYPQLEPMSLNIPLHPPSSTISAANASLSMERTPSGHSIVSGTALEVSNKDKHTLSDADAAKEMQSTFRRRRRHLVEERVLESLLKRSSGGAKLDNEALDSVLCATDKVFFHGRLAGRVRWEWSHPDSKRYEHELIGTTALRKAKDRAGYETLIILSRPMLWSGKYNHRLLLSTFLHEAVHCYLFIRCGFNATRDGGHTDGFRQIARIIDRWAGGLLQLRNTKADLNAFERFDVERELATSTSTSLNSNTSGMALESFQHQPHSLDVERVPKLALEAPARLPRIDRERYRMVAEMSRPAYNENLQASTAWEDLRPAEIDEDSTPRQGWSSFVAFASPS